MELVGELPYGVGISYVPGYPGLYRRLISLIGTLEIIPDTLLKREGEVLIPDRNALAELREYADDVALTLHGVGLSIGTATGWNDEYLQCLDRIMEIIPVAWHSEHLGYTTVSDKFLGTMLPLPRNEAVVEMLCERIIAIKERYGIPFLLENVANLMPEPDSTLNAPQFINTLCQNTGCRFLLDIYNLECDANNLGINMAEWLSEIRVDFIEELHVARGVVAENLWLDVHSNSVSDETIQLAKAVIERPGHNIRTVIFEFLEEALPNLGEDSIVAEAMRLKQVLA